MRPGQLARVGPSVVGALLLAWAGPARARAPAGDPPALEQPVVAGTAVEHELAVGATHAYSVACEAGRALEALVEQRGADVALTLEDPSGVRASERNAHDDPWRREHALWITAAAGPHRVLVRSVGARAGSYRLTLAAPRAPTPDDRRRAEATRDFEQALALRGAEEPAQREAALARFQHALEGFTAAGDRVGQAEALEELSLLQLSFNRQAQALALAQRGLALAEALGDRVTAVWLHRHAGTASAGLNDFPGAHEHLEEAQRLARDAGDDWALAAIFNARAGVALRAEDIEGGIQYLERAIATARGAGNGDVEWAALNNLGVFYKNVGEYDRALQAYERTLALLRARRNESDEARVSLNIANIQRLLGQPARALEAYERCLAYARKIGSGADEARALSNMAIAHSLLGEHDLALGRSRRALELWTAVGDRSGQALALWHAGEALGELGRFGEAETALSQALTRLRELRDVRSEAGVLASWAEVERDRGDLPRALAYVRQAIGLTEELRSRLTSPELRASFVAVGQEKYELLVDVELRLEEREPGRGHAEAALEASEAARARVLLEALVEARADIRQGIEPALLGQERGLEKQLGEASDRLGRLLARQAPEAEVAAATAEFEDLGGRHRRLLAGIRQTSPAYAALMLPSPSSAAELRELLDDDTVLLEFALGRERSTLFALTRQGLSTHALAGREELERGAREVYGLLTARQRAAPGALGVEAVRVAAERLREEAAALSQLLLGPLATRLAGEWSDKRLAIVASGALAYLPFGALPEPGTGGEPLLARHEIVSLPSASVLALSRQQLARRPSARPELAVLADPVFDPADPRVARATSRRAAATPAPSAGAGPSLSRAAQALGRNGFPRLPFSRQEAGAIAALAAPGTVAQAVDFQASRGFVESGGLAGRSIVHFATHGLLNSAHPDLSGLVLSLVDEKGAWQDGFLRMADIYNLRLDSELVVLSACQTGLGREVRGEGLIGVTRGFMYAGVPRVVASLWQVDDQSTAELMRIFYRGLLRERRRPAEALRLAQLELSRQKRWAAPYYWAGFVLQGEWR